MSSRSTLRPKVIDLNIVPPDVLRRPLSLTTLLLVLFVLIGSALQLPSYARYRDGAAAKSDLEQQIAAAKAASALEVSRSELQMERAKKLQAEIEDLEKAIQTARQAPPTLAKSQAPWWEIVGGIIGAQPAGIQLTSIQLEGGKLTVAGLADRVDHVVSYAGSLRSIQKISSVSVKSIAESVPKTPQPGGAPIPTGTPSNATPSATPTATITATPSHASPTATAMPSPTVTPTPSAPTSTPTPTATPTASPTPTPTKQYSVVEKLQSYRAEPNATGSYIRGKAVDSKGNLVPGLHFKLINQDASWSAIHPRSWETADGTFEFYVTKGKYSVMVVEATSEVASGLYTGGSDMVGVYDWQVTFRKNPETMAFAASSAYGGGEITRSNWLEIAAVTPTADAKIAFVIEVTVREEAAGR